jgi:hypothetical protein
MRLIVAPCGKARSITRNAVKNGESGHSSVELLPHLLRDQADVLSKIVRAAIYRHAACFKARQTWFIHRSRS